MFKKITRKNLEIFLEKHKSSVRVLDVGSGGSSYQRFFPNRVSVDIDPVRKPDIVADAHNLPFKDGEFELVLCTEVLEHVRDPRRVLSEMSRVLKIGGKIILTTRFMYPLHDTPHDYWRFTKFGLQELFKDWNVIEIVPETKTFSAIGALLQRLSFQTTLRFNYILKFFLLCAAMCFDATNGLIKKEFGNIQKTALEETIMTTGYYVVATKK